MANIFSRLYPGDVAHKSGGLALRKLMKSIELALDVFFDFKNAGTHNTDVSSNSEYTLENQGTDSSVSFKSLTGKTYGITSVTPGEGFKVSHTTPMTAIQFVTAGFQLLGVDSDFAAGAKTIVFRLSAGDLRSGANGQILSPNDKTPASFGVGASTATEPYHAYAREVQGSAIIGLGRAVNTDYCVDGTHFAWFGGTKNVIGKNVIVTTGSAAAPSATKIYIDGELAAVFDLYEDEKVTEIGCMDLTSSDGIIRCFKSAKSGTSSQDWNGYTMSYFGMTRGEMSADEVRVLNDKLNSLNDDGNLSDEEGVFEGPLSKVGAFVAASGLSDVGCVVDVDGQQSTVPGSELAAHFTSMGFAAEDIVRFEYPT